MLEIQLRVHLRIFRQKKVVRKKIKFKSGIAFILKHYIEPLEVKFSFQTYITSALIFSFAIKYHSLLSGNVYGARLLVSTSFLSLQTIIMMALGVHLC